MRPETRCVGYELAKIYAELGNQAEAIKWFRDFTERCSDESLNQLAGFDPLLAPLVGDAEFESIRNSLSEKVEKEWGYIENMEREGPL